MVNFKHMNNPELITYIHTQLQSGLTPDTIATQLRNGGWQEVDIQNGFAGAQQNILPTAMAAAPADQVQAAATTLPAAVLPPPLNQSRFKTGWQLFKQSIGIIKNNPGLSRYVIISTLWALLLFVILSAIYVIDYMNGKVLTFDTTDDKGAATIGLTVIGYLVFIVWWIIQTTITFFYATALSSHVLSIFRAQQTTYAQNIAASRKKIIPIMTFAIINVIVGIILNAIERIRYIGWIVAKILGVGWNLATAFAIPLLADKSVSGLEATKESLKLFKANWGETIVARVSLGGLFFLIYFLIAVPLTVGLAFGLGTIFGFYGVIGAAALFVIGIVIMSVIEILARNILDVALYYYATYKVIPPNFSAELLASVFTTKRKK